jgi:hypothetical protein
MKTSTSNNPHMAKGATKSGYRPLGEQNKHPKYIEQFPNCIDPFRIPLAKRFVDREPKYIPVGPIKRYSKVDKSVNIMLGMSKGEIKKVYSNQQKVERFIAKAKRLCPNGGFEILATGRENGKDYCKIRCTSV